MNRVDIFPWNEHFNTGLITVDKQHKKLVEILNNLASNIAHNSNEHDLNIIFEELTNYTIYHFETEEAIWHKYLPNNPLDTDHQAIHQQFVDTVLKLKKEQKTRPLIEVAEEALGFLAKWLASHILETDQYMAHLIFAIRDGKNIHDAKQIANEKMSGSTRLLIDIILSIYNTLSTNTLLLMKEVKSHQRLEEKITKEEHYRHILLELSTKFINLPIEEIDENINSALETIASFVNADRGYIFDYDFNKQTTTNTYEWCQEGIIPQIDELQNVSLDNLPNWPKSHEKGDYVLVQDVDLIKDKSLKNILSNQGIKSLITFPLFKNTNCIGFVGFDAVKVKHTFSKSDIIILEIFSKLLNNLLQRKDSESELAKKEHYQRALLDNFPFMVWLKDENSNFLAINKPMAKACGFSNTKDVIGKTDYDIWPQKHADLYTKDDKEVLLSGESKTTEEPAETDEGHIWIETYKSPVSIDSNIIGTVGFARDITKQKNIKQKLIKERNLFKKYLNTVESIIISLDNEGNITLINRKACELLGYTQKQLIGQNWFEMCLAQPKGMEEIYPVFKKLIKGSVKGLEYYENHIISKSKRKYLIAWHNAFLKDLNGNIIGILSSGDDITVLREQQQRLEHMAHYDVLTNLPNRLLLSDRLNQAILYAKRHKTLLAVIYLDLDGFKEINDTYGHSQGDVLLKAVATRIQVILRQSDTIARLGGDEFVIILHDVKDKNDCITMLNNILLITSTPVISKEIHMQVSASIGITFFNEEDLIDADQLIRQADYAMYQAKLEGKNRFNFFNALEDKNQRTHNENIDEVKNSLDNKHFILYYQPKINMESGKFIGVEALLRWNHPKKGFLSPESFLTHIENNQNISLLIDSWVIKAVIEQIQKWKEKKINIKVSINISPSKILENDFIDKLLNLLNQYPKVKTSDFTFEILETSALNDINHISKVMKECNKVGIHFLLDDFGTGYSTLTYLKNLPAKHLKIDQSFVRDMLEDIDDMAILEGIISLASAFRRDVIAEGVESIEQGKMLLQLGCKEAQGNIIAKAMSAEELLKWKENWKPYKQWQNVKAYSRDTLPILYGIVESKIWIKEVVSYLEKGNIPKPFLKDTDCRFGQWLQQEIIKETKYKEKLIKIENLHVKMHKEINLIIKKRELKNSKKDIENMTIKILSCHNKFIDELKKFNFLEL